MKAQPKSSFLLILFITLAACSKKQSPDQNTHLGEVRFEVSGAADAQPFFHKGLLLLHSFEYADAREQFIKAQEADPDFAMAYWGEAMTYNHSLWRSQDKEAAVAAFEKLDAAPGKRLEKAGTELEKDFLKAAHLLYGEGDKKERDQAYSAFMADLYQKYPGNQEVAAFYALSMLGAVPVGRDEEAYGKAALIAQGILKENPEHPGALHYLIHSYDDPVHAHLAKQAADSYSVVAPDAAHALHMPSHIYVALGMWKEVIQSNIASYQASVQRMQDKGLDNDARSYHALHWLLYGHLQKGNLEEARQIMKDMVQYAEETPSKSARSYLLGMKGNYLVETGEWDSEMAGIKVDLEDLNIVDRAVHYFIEGMKTYRNNNPDSLEAIILRLEEERKQASLLVDDRGVPMCSAQSSRNLPNQLDIDQAHVVELELRALHAMLEGQEKGVAELLQAATELQNSISYSYGPPPIVKPSFELYGEWLLEQGRPEEALRQFELALERGPKRVMALKGKVEVLKQLGKEQEMEKTNQILKEI